MGVPLTFPAREFLTDELEARGWTVERFAHETGLPKREVLGLLAGRKRFNPATAERVGKALGTSGALWVDLQATHDGAGRV